MYLKILIERKEFEKAMALLEGPAAKSYNLWLEHRQARMKVHWAAGNLEAVVSILLSILKTNFDIVHTTDFQSVYNMHETLITVLVKLLDEVTPDFLETVMAAEDGPVPEFTTASETIVKLLGAFRVSAKYNPADKSVNGHNCRKSGILSEMLLWHKLLMRCPSTTPYKFFMGPLKSELDLFTEVSSLVFDIGPYLAAYVTDNESKTDLLKHFEGLVEAKEDPTRKCRAIMNLHKLKHYMNMFELEEQTKLLQTLYFDNLKLDGKPEKGERKIADDFVLLIAELWFTHPNAEKELYCIGLLEYALRISPYNFDIQMALVRIYDRMGLTTSFAGAHKELDLKGVLLDSLGYLQFRHSVEYGAFESLLRPFS